MKRDFSENARQQLLSLVSQVESEKWCDFTDWLGDRWYDFEAWLGLLDIKDYIDDINGYHKKVIDKNNTTSEDIERIFNDVNQVSSNYKSRLTALLADLNGYMETVGKSAETIAPAAGKFKAEYIGDGLKKAVNDYLTDSERLAKISGDGISKEEVEAMDNKELNRLLAQYIDIALKMYPNIKVGDKVEIPIGPGVNVYYKIDAKIKGDSAFNCDYVVKNHQLEFEDFSAKIGALSGSLDKDGKGSISIGGGPAGAEISIGENGPSFSCENVIDDTTYTYKYELDLMKHEFTMEEKITTDLDEAEVSSAIGITFSDNNRWKPLPEPVPVTSPYTVQIPSFDVDWEEVGVAVLEGVVVTAAVVAIGAAVYFSGGTVLAVCVI